LRHCPVPALARPFRLLALQEREGIAPIARAGRHLAQRLRQAGIVRQLPPLPDARFLLRPPLWEAPMQVPPEPHTGRRLVVVRGEMPQSAPHQPDEETARVARADNPRMLG